MRLSVFGCYHHENSSTAADVVDHHIYVLLFNSRDDTSPSPNIKQFLQKGHPPLFFCRYFMVNHPLSNLGIKRTSFYITVIGHPSDSFASQGSSVIINKTNKIADTSLRAGFHGLQELDKTTAQHFLWVSTLGDSLNEIPMCCPRKRKIFLTVTFLEEQILIT